MIRLKNLIMHLLGTDAREDDKLAPSTVMSLIVPRNRFSEVAKALKKSMHSLLQSGLLMRPFSEGDTVFTPVFGGSGNIW